MSALAIRGGRRNGDWQGWGALAALVVAVAMPLVDHLGAKTYLFDAGPGALVAVALVSAGMKWLCKSGSTRPGSDLK